MSILGAVLLCGTPSLAAEPSVQTKPIWLKEVGVGLSGGVRLSEPADSEGVEPAGVLGGTLSWGVFRFKSHRALLSASIFGLLGAQSSEGTRVIAVKSQTNPLLEVLAGYDFTWKMLVVGSRFGLGLDVVRTTATLYDVTQEVVGEQLLIERQGIEDQTQSTGASAAFVGGIEVGVELGQLFRHPETLEVRALGQALLRGERQDFLVGLSLVFWPSAISTSQ